MMNEPQHPIRRTKNTPPTLANPNSLDDVGSTSVFEHKPPPRSSHHFFFRSWRTPFSCNISIALLMGVLYGESGRKNRVFSFQSISKEIGIWNGNLVELTSRQRDTVSLVIDQTSDLVEIAVPLHSVLDRGGFHEESVIAFLQHPIDTLVVALGEHARPRFLHGSPHALIGGIIGILENDYFQLINYPNWCFRIVEVSHRKSPWRKWTWIHQPRPRTWFLSA